MTYAGHLPNQNPVQRHSAGDLFPIYILAWGDGTWQWVDPVTKLAGYRLHSQRDAVAAATRYAPPDSAARAITTILRKNYLEAYPQ